MRLCLLILSLIGACVVLAFSASTLVVQDLAWRKEIISSFYVTLCIIGSIAALLPAACTKAIGPKDSAWIPHVTLTHHPECEGFSGHELHLRGRSLCAGCTGLLTGALISVSLIAAYFAGVDPTQGASILTELGVAAALLGLFVPLSNSRSSLLRFAIGASFIVGMTSILIGLDSQLRSIDVDSFIILMALFWVFTRISLSQFVHKRICANCLLRCVQRKREEAVAASASESHTTSRGCEHQRAGSGTLGEYSLKSITTLFSFIVSSL